MSTRTSVVLAFSVMAVLTPLPHAGAQQGMMIAQSGAVADGEIRKIDKDAGKLTLKHGPIPSIDMPPMTMVYRVKDPAMLETFKVGDKVKFSAEMVGGVYVVTAIERRPAGIR